MLHINNLPNEILFGIFKLLSPQDLKTAVLTCKLWKDLGEDPSLWRWSVVKLGSSEDFPKLSIPRLQVLQEIKIAHGGLIIQYCHNDSVKECHWRKNGMLELFKVILEIPTVTRISGFDYCEGLATVEPKLLASVLNRLEELEPTQFLAPEQIEALFTAIAMNTTLKLLDIEHFRPLSILGSGLFASAISNVDEVILDDFDLTFEDLVKNKMEALFSLIRKEERPLTKLTVDACLCYGIDPDMLGIALNRLEEVTVTSYHDWLTLDQVNAILKNLAGGESEVKRLMLEGLHPRVVEHLNNDLVKRTELKLGKFYDVNWERFFEEEL